MRDRFSVTLGIGEWLTVTGRASTLHAARVDAMRLASGRTIATYHAEHHEPARTITARVFNPPRFTISDLEDRP